MLMQSYDLIIHAYSNATLSHLLALPEITNIKYNLLDEVVVCNNLQLQSLFSF